MAATTEPRRPAARKPPAGWVYGGALGAFFATLAVLGVQADSPAAPREPRQIVVRRVIETVVIHHSARPRRAQTTPAPVTTSAPAPLTTSAPAPLTTRSS